MIISNSKANTYLRCPRRYAFKYVDKLDVRAKAVQLKRGSWLHELLMVYYDGHDWKTKHTELTKEFMKLFEQEREEYGDLPGECSRIFRSYLATYAKGDVGLRVVDSEIDNLVDLPNGDQFRFIIDLIVELPDGTLWAWDHKTVKAFMDQDFMLIDSQLARYFWSARRMGYNLTGVMFNEIITKPPTIPKFLEPSQRLEMKNNISCDVYTYYSEIKRLGLDPKPYAGFLTKLKAQNDRWFRRTHLPRDRPMVVRMMKELMMTAAAAKRAERLNHFPRAARKDCKWDCDFIDLCIAELQGGDLESIIKHRYVRREGEPTKELPQ